MFSRLGYKRQNLQFIVSHGALAKPRRRRLACAVILCPLMSPTRQPWFRDKKKVQKGARREALAEAPLKRGDQRGAQNQTAH